MKQYIRKVRVTAEGSSGAGFIVNPMDEADTHEMRVEFSVSKGISSTQNSLTIKIYNLKKASRDALGKELDTVTLEAGYTPPGGGKGNVGIIAKAQIRDIEHKQSGPDIITEISCGEGDKAFRKATTSKTYKAGTEVKEVVEDLYKELEKQGVKRGEWKFPEDIPKFKRPYSTCGSCKTELDTLSRGKNFHWSVQNGVMEVIPGDGYIGGIVSLDAESGLIGTPTITDNGVKAIALLNPEIRPNRRVKISSQTLEMNAEGGEYRVSECTYSGDNYGGDFIVSITGESINKKKVDEGKAQDKSK